MFLFGNPNTNAQDPNIGGCPCDCDKILYSQYGDDENRIVIIEYENNCSIFGVTITGCGNRTVLGFSFDFVIDPDNPCLNQNWTIKDNTTDMVLGVYNPTITNPTFGLFIPPVLPCQSRDFTFKLCPENLTLCKYKTFDLGINFVFADGDPPCPTTPKQLVFAYVSSVTPEDLNESFTLNQNESILEIDFSNLESSFSHDDLILKINDVFGNVLISVKLSEIKNNINLDKLVSGKYFATVNSNYGLLGVFSFSIIK